MKCYQRALSSRIFDYCRRWTRLSTIHTFQQTVFISNNIPVVNLVVRHEYHTSRVFRLSANNASADYFVNKLFSKGSTCSQSQIDEFFRTKPRLTTRHVGTILDSAVGMKKKTRLDVLKMQHLVHITDELRRLRQGSWKPFETAALVCCLQATSNNDAQTSGM